MVDAARKGIEGRADPLEGRRRATDQQLELLVAHQATGLQAILALVAGGMGVAFVARSVGANLQRTGVVLRPLRNGPRLITGPAWRAGELSASAGLLRDVIVELGAGGRLDGSPPADAAD